ncbi:hypothetical protein ACUNV4_00085 [Granulosicoccus sp. 3-233]
MMISTGERQWARGCCICREVLDQRQGGGKVIALADGDNLSGQ